MLFETILRGNFEFHPEYWTKISDSGMFHSCIRLFACCLPSYCYLAVLTLSLSHSLSLLLIWSLLHLSSLLCSALFLSLCIVLLFISISLSLPLTAISISIYLFLHFIAMSISAFD